MRITGGTLCGRRLSVPSGARVRPTADRVREGLFGSLADLRGARVLDLYAGSGSLGIEALSRGAMRALFVDRSARSLAVLRSNLQALQLLSQARVQRGDACAVIRRLGRGLRRGGDAAERFDLIFVDPPYGKGETPRVLPALRDSGILGPTARIVVESRGEVATLLPLVGFSRRAEHRYGDTRVIQYAAQPGEAARSAVLSDAAEEEL